MKMGIQGENVEPRESLPWILSLHVIQNFPFLLSLTNEHAVSV